MNFMNHCPTSIIFNQKFPNSSLSQHPAHTARPFQSWFSRASESLCSHRHLDLPTCPPGSTRVHQVILSNIPSSAQRVHQAFSISAGHLVESTHLGEVFGNSWALQLIMVHQHDMGDDTKNVRQPPPTSSNLGTRLPAGLKRIDLC